MPALTSLRMSDRWLAAWGLTALAFGSASLIVPLYLVELGGDAFDLGVLFATGSFIGVPGALVFGNLADRTGKRRVFVLAAMGITAAAMAAIPLLDRIPQVVFANAALWFGFAAATPVLTLLVVAGEPEDRWSLLIARLNRIQGIGWAAGLGVGFAIVAGSSGAVDTVTAQRWVCFASAASAGAGLVLGVRTLPADPAAGTEPSPGRLRRQVRRAGRFNVRGAAFPFAPARFDPRGLHPRVLLRRFSPQLGLYFLAVLVAFTGFGVFFAPLPAHLAEAGYGSSETFGLYLLLNVGAAVFFGQAASLGERFDVTTVHAGGLLLRAAMMALLVPVGVVLRNPVAELWAVGGLLFVVGTTWAVIAVTAATLVTKLAPPAIRGEALGAYSALVAVGGGLGGLLGGWLAAFGYLVAFGVAGGLIGSAAALVVVLSQRATTAATPTPESA
ncbi:MFS transporter [Halovenus sp. WSH3]|uniref:MFS transporter n=2 Tax=Halovenus carboxidivorans TaxID=2692199 RepID=A0A6B0TAQ6_9EURY|nr:MFS transporter [Halovenus carboxidivorans]